MPELAPPELIVITGSDARKHLEAARPECADVVRRAYLTHAAGDSVLPHSSFLRFPARERDRIIALPGYLGGEFDVAGIKWIASVPGNTGHGLPRASAVLLLNDPATGFAYACMESSLISATRTAGSAVLAAEALTGGRTARRIGFVGTGLIADHVRRFFADLSWEVGGYRLFDTDPAAAHRFAGRLTGADVVVADEVSGAFEDCDVVVLATVAGTPHLHDPALLAHRPVVLHLSLRDLGEDLVLGAQNFTDDIDHVMREGTSLHLAEQRAGHRDFVAGTLADVLTGTVSRDPGRAAVFSPFGLGVLDLAVGSWLAERVRAAGTALPATGFYAEVGL
jgi:2,3-diaminopropionate biosynthesis protein SbnB